MSPTTSPTNHPDLTQVRVAFEAWRQQRKPKERIPNSLWDAALSLLDRHPLKTVCRELGLSGQQLRLRRVRALPANQPPTFVELTAQDLAVMQSVAPLHREPVLNERLTVVVERRDGGKLSLTLPVASLDTVITSFVRA